MHLITNRCFTGRGKVEDQNKGHLSGLPASAWVSPSLILVSGEPPAWLLQTLQRLRSVRHSHLQQGLSRASRILQCGCVCLA